MVNSTCTRIAIYQYFVIIWSKRVTSSFVHHFVHVFGVCVDAIETCPVCQDIAILVDSSRSVSDFVWERGLRRYLRRFALTRKWDINQGSLSTRVSYMYGVKRQATQHPQSVPFYPTKHKD